MTVAVQTPVASAVGNGVTTVFPFNFLILDDDDINVYVDEVLKTKGFDYTVSGVGVPAGGSITFISGAPASGLSVVIERDSEIKRDTDYQDYGDFEADVVNADFDRLWLAMQEILYKYRLAPSLPAGSPLAGLVKLPDPEVGKYIRWNALENNLENGDPAYYSGTILPTSSVINTFADLATTPATTAGMIVYLKQHTSGGLGGGYFQDTAGTITNNSGTLINNAVTSGRHWKRVFDYIKVEDFGAVGGGHVDDTESIQTAINYLAINGGKLVFTQSLYLITSQLILPFGNNATDKMFSIDFGFCTIKSNVSSPTGATFTGLISGYMDGSTPIASISGTEAHVAANVVMSNLTLEGFGTAIRLHNFNYGCRLNNIQTANSFNGIELSRCFYLLYSEIQCRGTGSGDGGVGFKTTAFSNVMPCDGVKVFFFTTGMQLGGFDGGKMSSCSSEGCSVGVELITESTVMHLDTFYLEGNTVNFKFSATTRRCIISNSWFQGDSDFHFSSALSNGQYANIVLMSVFFNDGITNSPIQNVFGDIINPTSDPLSPPIFSGLPNLRVLSPRYELDPSASGYNGLIRSLDSREYNGLIATAYGGRFRNGIVTGVNSPYQSVVDNSGSMEFTTEFADDGFTSLLWRVSIAHSVGTWSRTFLIFYDNDSGVWRLYKPDAAGMTLDSTVSCANSGGFLRLKAPVFTTPSVNYSLVRTL